MTKQQSKWRVTFTDGNIDHIFADIDATEDQAREKTVGLMRSARENLILSSSPSQIPEVIEGEADSINSRDFASRIEKVERAA